LVCFVNDTIKHFGYTSSFDLLDEMLPDFFPVCCDSDGDVLQVSLRLSITLWAEGLEREHTSLQRSRTRRETRTNASWNVSIWFTSVILYRALRRVQWTVLLAGYCLYYGPL